MTSDRIETPLEGRPAAEWDPDAPIEAPLRLHRTPVLGQWTDYNGHMSESCYLLVFGDNADALFRYLGIDERYRATGRSLYTRETHLHHHREVSADEPLELSVRLLDHDAVRLHLFHEMRQADTGVLLASAEQLLVHVDTRAARSSPMPDDLAARVAAVALAHAALPRPTIVGRPLGIRRN